MIGLITIGTVFNYLTRAILGVVVTQDVFQSDLGVGEQEYSWITAFFQVGLLLQPVAGYIMDIIGLKLGFGLFALAWALLTALHGAAMNWQMLAVLRGLLGFAEGIGQPGGMKATAEWFPARERGFAGGVYNIGASVGSMLAPPLVVWAILTYNWQTRLCHHRRPAAWSGWRCGSGSTTRRSSHPRCRTEERDYIAAGQEAHLAADGHARRSAHIAAAAQLLGHRAAALPGRPDVGHADLLGAALPDARCAHFDLKQIALFAWMPFLAADLGCLFGPTLVIWLQKRGVSLINARAVGLHRRRLLMMGMAVRRRGRQPLRGHRAAEPGRLRAPDAVGHGHHDVVRPVQAQRSRDGRRHGRHVRQRGAADLLAARSAAWWRPSATRRSSSAWPCSTWLGAIVALDPRA